MYKEIPGALQFAVTIMCPVREARRLLTTAEGLEAMERFLAQGEPDDRQRQEAGKLWSIVTLYLTTALRPAV